MRVTVVRPGELGRTEAALWAKFQQAAPETRNPFLSLTFAQVVGRARANARVAVVEDGGEITAFLPFERAPLRMGMPIGYPMNGLQAFVSQDPAIDARSVVRKAGLRGLRFEATPAQQRALVPHHYAGTIVRSPVIDLAGGYQSYLQSLSGSLRSENGRKRRALAREAGTLTFDWDSPDPEHLRKLIGWKAGRYEGMRRMFADPTAHAIAAELAAAKSEDCHGVVNVLLAGDRLVAANLGLAGPSGFAGWIIAYDPELRRFSPGTMLAFAIAEDAVSRGIVRFELGYGQAAYKFRLANDSYPVAAGAVWTNGMEESARRLYRRYWYDRPNRNGLTRPTVPVS
jgi:CelD/BcsL family acetyltransferase involved in cellulose biosynthesis